MGTVCYAPEIPILDRPINPYARTQENKDVIVQTVALNRTNLENVTIKKLDSKTQRDLGYSLKESSFNLQIPNITKAPPSRATDISENSIFKKMRDSPEVATNGPPLELATPCQLPSISEAIVQRRKSLKAFRYEGQSRGVQLAPYRYKADNITYFGQWQRGIPHGKGLIYFPDGSVFEGGFTDGKSSGKGRLISKNGDYYQGTVIGNVASGLGVSQSDVIRYEGQFENNLPHGQGIQTALDNSTRFVGTFFDGNKVSGVMTWGDNGQFVYEGRFADGVFSGRGVLRSPDGVYYGQFLRGHKHGIGQMYNPDGTLLYKGNWTQSIPESLLVSNGNWMTK